MRKSIIAVVVLLMLAFFVLALLHIGGQFFLVRSARRQIHNKFIAEKSDSRAPSKPGTHEDDTKNND